MANLSNKDKLIKELKKAKGIHYQMEQEKLCAGSMLGISSHSGIGLSFDYHGSYNDAIDWVTEGYERKAKTDNRFNEIAETFRYTRDNFEPWAVDKNNKDIAKKLMARRKAGKPILIPAGWGGDAKGSMGHSIKVGIIGNQLFISNRLDGMQEMCGMNAGTAVYNLKKDITEEEIQAIVNNFSQYEFSRVRGEKPPKGKPHDEAIKSTTKILSNLVEGGDLKKPVLKINKPFQQWYNCDYANADLAGESFKVIGDIIGYDSNGLPNKKKLKVTNNNKNEIRKIILDNKKEHQKYKEETRNRLFSKHLSQIKKGKPKILANQSKQIIADFLAEHTIRTDISNKSIHFHMRTLVKKLDKNELKQVENLFAKQIIKAYKQGKISKDVANFHLQGFKKIAKQANKNPRIDGTNTINSLKNKGKQKQKNSIKSPNDKLVQCAKFIVDNYGDPAKAKQIKQVQYAMIRTIEDLSKKDPNSKKQLKKTMESVYAIFKDYPELKPNFIKLYKKYKESKKQKQIKTHKNNVVKKKKLPPPPKVKKKLSKNNKTIKKKLPSIPTKKKKASIDKTYSNIAEAASFLVKNKSSPNYETVKNAFINTIAKKYLQNKKDITSFKQNMLPIRKILEKDPNLKKHLELAINQKIKQNSQKTKKVKTFAEKPIKLVDFLKDIEKKQYNQSAHNRLVKILCNNKEKNKHAEIRKVMARKHKEGNNYKVFAKYMKSRINIRQQALAKDKRNISKLQSNIKKYSNLNKLGLLSTKKKSELTNLKFELYEAQQSAKIQEIKILQEQDALLKANFNLNHSHSDTKALIKKNEEKIQTLKNELKTINNDMSKLRTKVDSKQPKKKKTSPLTMAYNKVKEKGGLKNYIKDKIKIKRKKKSKTGLKK